MKTSKLISLAVALCLTISFSLSALAEGPGGNPPSGGPEEGREVPAVLGAVPEAPPPA